ncbi:hypothetical protein, partial [Streptococcus suis]|uniref:hypothetical protein n=1 Tax=Streptococcus suis TaxID=1307 RepID=UPI001E487A1B
SPRMRYLIPRPKLRYHFLPPISSKNIPIMLMIIIQIIVKTAISPDRVMRLNKKSNIGQSIAPPPHQTLSH